MLVQPGAEWSRYDLLGRNLPAKLLVLSAMFSRSNSPRSGPAPISPGPALLGLVGAALAAAFLSAAHLYALAAMSRQRRPMRLAAIQRMRVHGAGERRVNPGRHDFVPITWQSVQTRGRRPATPTAAAARDDAKEGDCPQEIEQAYARERGGRHLLSRNRKPASSEVRFKLHQNSALHA
jgi:hypothetical protein